MNGVEELLRYFAGAPGREVGSEVLGYGWLGVAFLQPEGCLLARPVCSWWSDEEIVEGHEVEREGREAVLTLDPDAWHIHLATGGLGRWWDYPLKPRQYVTFQRRGGRLRRYETERLRRKIDGIQNEHAKDPGSRAAGGADR